MNSAAAPPAPQTAASAPSSSIPWYGLAAVLLGAFISTLNGRLSTFGLGDIRGAIHAGFDEGAWITTAQTVAQMLILPFVIWLGGVFGARRVLIEAALGPVDSKGFPFGRKSDSRLLLGRRPWV